MAANDSDNPATTTDDWAKAFIDPPPLTVPVNANFDSDVVAWFKSPGRGYQARMNACCDATWRCPESQGEGGREWQLWSGLPEFVKHLYRHLDSLPSPSVYRLRLLWRALHACQKTSIADSEPRFLALRAADFVPPDDVLG